jgi:hypothetical protein
MCGSDIGTCVAATCTKDADCGGNSVCLSYEVPQGCSSETRFACSTPADQCLSDTDCGNDGGIPNVCTFDGAKRVCVQGPGLCAGRPLTVERRVRLAGLVTSRAWA